MNVVFVSLHFEENRFYHKVGLCLQEMGVMPSFVSLSRQAKVELTQAGESLTALSDLLEGTRDLAEMGEAAIAALESKYDVISLKQVFAADQALKGLTERQKVRRMVGYLLAWEQYLNAHPVDCLVTDLGAELIRTTCHLVAKSRGIPCLFMHWAPFSNELYLNTDDFQMFDNLSCELETPLSENEKQRIREMIQATKKKRPFVFATPLRLPLRRIVRFFSHLWIFLVVERGSHEHFNKFRHARVLLQRFVNKYRALTLYTKPDPREKYVFLPLHATDDYQLTVRAPHCIDQRYIVNLCARALPQGYKLYVKEHPALVGGVLFRELREMAKNENVRLLPVSMNSRPLIEKAQFIVTVNSTAGIESLLYEKTVVTLGHSWYRGHGLTIDVDNFFNLPLAFKQAMTFKVDREKLYALLHRVMQIGYPGHPLDGPSDDNVRKVSRAIYRKLQALGLVCERTPKLPEAPCS